MHLPEPASSPISEPLYERQSTVPPLILASASPRRRELLALLGLPYEVIPSRYDEPADLPEPVRLTDFVMHLALEKACEVARRVGPGLVIGADTEVAMEEIGLPMGKPQDAADARRMLRGLSGRAHLVCTGLAVVPAFGNGQIGEPRCMAEQTWVFFRALTDAMISDYVATGEPLDKAGAYGAQGFAAPFIERYEGDFFNVVGLPVCALGRLLEQMGYRWWEARAL
jgi:septum formation protein